MVLKVLHWSSSSCKTYSIYSIGLASTFSKRHQEDTVRKTFCPRERSLLLQIFTDVLESGMYVFICIHRFVTACSRWDSVICLQVDSAFALFLTQDLLSLTLNYGESQILLFVDSAFCPLLLKVDVV